MHSDQVSTSEPSKMSQFYALAMVYLPNSRVISFFWMSEFYKYFILCMPAMYFEISLCHIHHSNAAVELSSGVVMGNAPLQGFSFFSVVDLTHAVL